MSEKLRCHACGMFDGEHAYGCAHVSTEPAPPASQESAGEADQLKALAYAMLAHGYGTDAKLVDGAAATIATLTAELADRNKAVIAQAGNVRALADALKTLTQAARISGGVAGADSNLMTACDKAENALSLTGVGCAVNAVLDVLEQRDSLRKECEGLREALREIAAIEDEMYGGDWDEIERARDIAEAALSAGDTK